MKNNKKIGYLMLKNAKNTHCNGAGKGSYKQILRAKKKGV